MSTKTELGVRPLEAHELDVVNGAGVHIQTQTWSRGGSVSLANDLGVYGFQAWGNPTVSKPIELLAHINGPGGPVPHHVWD
jgi:hypothetical protein